MLHLELAADATPEDQLDLDRAFAQWIAWKIEHMKLNEKPPGIKAIFTAGYNLGCANVCTKLMNHIAEKTGKSPEELWGDAAKAYAEQQQAKHEGTTH